MQFGAKHSEVGELISAANARAEAVRVETIADRPSARFTNIPQVLVLVLVRPDRHVAWRGNTIADDSGEIILRVRWVTSAATQTNAGLKHRSMLLFIGELPSFTCREGSTLLVSA